jgi:ribonuclease inhibitor
MSATNIIHIDGALINSEQDFHKVISSALDFGPYYGNNLDALWDMLSSGAAGGVVLHWKDADISRQRLGPIFDTIIRLFNETKALDAKLGLVERFEFILE